MNGMKNESSDIFSVGQQILRANSNFTSHKKDYFERKSDLVARFHMVDPLG